MNHSTDTLVAQSTKKIFSQCWLPSDEVKAVIFIAHGLSEHSGRYLPFVEHFVSLGYAVYALDHEGHGRSEGQRGYISRFSNFVDTLFQFFTVIQKTHPDKKIFLVGHSMGGVIAVNYLLKHQSTIAGCILSGAALATDGVITPGQKKLLTVLSVLLPKLPLIKLEGEAVSRDASVVKAYETDPLVFRGKATSRLLSEILSSAETGLDNADKIKLPLLILHGGDDLLANPKGSQQLYDRVSSIDKTLKIYEHLYHEIFLEKEKIDVFSDIENWLSSRI